MSPAAAARRRRLTFKRLEFHREREPSLSVADGDSRGLDNFNLSRYNGHRSYRAVVTFKARFRRVTEGVGAERRTGSRDAGWCRLRPAKDGEVTAGTVRRGRQSRHWSVRRHRPRRVRWCASGPAPPCRARRPRDRCRSSSNPFPAGSGTVYTLPPSFTTCPVANATSPTTILASDCAIVTANVTSQINGAVRELLPDQHEADQQLRVTFPRAAPHEPRASTAGLV